MPKRCIWCLHEEPKVSFKNVAHIFPKSLGGERTCSNVCDSCNSYFGCKQPNLPSIEIALKEPLNISRTFLLSESEKKIERFKSEYFEYNLKSQVFKPKYKYRLISDFQIGFTRQFKRGVYKVFLEERNESVGDAFDSQFDFIREFARRGIGDYPVLYCKPGIPVVAVSKSDTFNPVIRFTEKSEDIMKQYGFYSYYFITHELAFPVIRAYEITLKNYIQSLYNIGRPTYSEIIPLKYITDLDFMFTYAFGKPTT